MCTPVVSSSPAPRSKPRLNGLLGTFGCIGSCAVKGRLIDKHAFQKKPPRLMQMPGPCHVPVSACVSFWGLRAKGFAVYSHPAQRAYFGFETIISIERHLLQIWDLYNQVDKVAQCRSDT